MRKRLWVPALFTAACTPLPSSDDGGPPDAGGVCQVVKIADAGRLLYGCADGRMCSAPSPGSDPFQVCPGDPGGDCALLVEEDGGSMTGFC